MTLLEEGLDGPCVEMQTKSKSGTNRINIANKERLSMEEFFGRK